MGWAVGFDSNWGRDIGYGVPAQCDFPECIVSIDRGLGCVCGDAPYGGEHGCGLFFCGKHLSPDWGGHMVCIKCLHSEPPFTPKPDSAYWMIHKLLDDSWQQWRDENPDSVTAIREALQQGAFVTLASEE
jgi:hypothetical protein